MRAVVFYEWVFSDILLTFRHVVRHTNQAGNLRADTSNTYIQNPSLKEPQVSLIDYTTRTKFFTSGTDVE